MKDQYNSISPSSNPAPLHCQHRSASGRRFCRMAISDPESGLCFRHAAEKRKERNSAHAAAKLIGIGEYGSAIDINRALTELYKLLARDEVSPRRGAVMVYACSVLLRTLPAIDRELNPPDQEPIIFDLPRPKHDWPEDMDPAVTAYENWTAFIAANPQHAGARPQDFLRTPATPGSTVSSTEKTK